MKLKRIRVLIFCVAMVLSTMSFNVFANELNVGAGTELTLSVTDSSISATYMNIADDIPFEAVDNGDGTLGIAAPVPVEVATYEELVAALEKDNANVIMTADIEGTATQSSGYGKAGIVLNAGDVLDGRGHKLTINGANGTWDCAIAMLGGEVKDLTVSGAMRGIFMPGANGDVVIDKCVLEDVIYTFNSDAGSTEYRVTIKNTTLNGWTSYSAVHKSVAFENCTFGEGNGYAFCRPYQATTFTGCEFNKGFELDATKSAANTLEFDGCTYAGEEFNEETAASLFYNGGTVVIDGETVVFAKYVPPVAQVGDKKYTTLKEALEAVSEGCTITLLEDITVSEAWDCRYNGAKITVPVTIDGNGKTLKLTGAVDDKNWNTVFRFEADATVKNLTIDASEATGIQRGISSKYNITVDNCTLIGNGTSAKRAVIYGEGAGNAISNVTATITNSRFTNWSYGVSDNQSGKDAESVSITGNTFNNASVLVSAAQTVTFTGNTVTEGYVNISSYTAADTLIVTATDNTLVGTDDIIQVNPDNITADDSFITPVAKIGSKYYETLSKAINKVQDGQIITILDDIDVTERIFSNGKDITIDLNGKTMSFAASKNNSGILVDNTNSLITFKDGTINLDSVVADDSIFRNFGDGSANTVFDNVKITGKGFNVCYVFNAEVGKISFINNTTVNLRLPAGDNPQIIFCTQLNGTIVIHNADIYVDLNEIDAPVFVNCIVDIKSSNIDIKNAGYAMRLVKGSISDGSSVTVTGTENGIVNYYENDDGTELILDLPIAISNGSVVDVKSCITDVKIGTSAPITITNNSLLIADNVSVGENLIDPNFELFINGHKVSGDSMTIKFTDACWYKFMVKTNTGNVLYTVNGSPVENTLFIKEGIYNIEYTVINNNISHFGTFVLTIVKNIQVDEGPFKYTLTFVTNGGSSVNDASIIAGTKVDLSKYLTTREGYTFDGWYRDVTLTKKADKITLNQDTTVYAGWTAIKPVASDYIPKVFTKEHIAYILGTPDGKINPTDDLTRAEAAAIFFRLLDDDVRNSGLSKENKFDDVNIGDWYNEAVSTLTNLKILNGRSNSKFAPNEKIKRCEFVSIIARLIDISYSGDTIFSDIEGHWAEEHINIAAYLGWVKGNNGKFRPDNSISRAEAMAIINRSLDRKPASINDLIPTMKVWIDNTDKNAWYYLDVAEATNSHSFRNKADGTGETWTAIK